MNLCVYGCVFVCLCMCVCVWGGVFFLVRIEFISTAVGGTKSVEETKEETKVEENEQEEDHWGHWGSRIVSRKEQETASYV